jgi:hypothetical protein
MTTRTTIAALAASWLFGVGVGECQPPAAPAANPSAAQIQATGGDVLKIKNLVADLPVPESPAFAALSLSPETIIRPSTPREFATSLLNGVDRNGHLQTGVAVDVAPYLVFEGSKITLGAYQASSVTRVLSRTTVSVATTKGATEDDKSIRLATGVHTTVFDTEDPRVNNDALFDCFATLPLFRPTSILGPDLEKQRLEFQNNVLVPGVEACRARFQRTARWNGTSWIVAAAPTWTSPTGFIGDLDGTAVSVWSSLAYGFDGVPGLSENAQVTVHVRRINNEVITDAKLPGGQETRDTTIAGARLRGGTTGFGLSFEAAYVRTSAPGRADDSGSRIAFTADRRVAENLWLTVSFSGEPGASRETSTGMSILSALRFGVGKNPTIGDDQVRKLMGQ